MSRRLQREALRVLRLITPDGKRHDAEPVRLTRKQKRAAKREAATRPLPFGYNKPKVLCWHQGLAPIHHVQGTLALAGGQRRHLHESLLRDPGWLVLNCGEPPTGAANELRVPWRNYRGVDRDREWWAALLSAQLAAGAKGIVACCFGGHGRTGTALAALLMVSEGLSAAEAIERVRTEHCAEAIESVEQERYLRSLEVKP